MEVKLLKHYISLKADIMALKMILKLINFNKLQKTCNL